MPRKGYVVQYVKPEKTWQVAKPTGSVLRKYNKKRPAVNYATKTARNNKPAYVTIYKKSGGKQKTRKYDG